MPNWLSYFIFSLTLSGVFAIVSNTLPNPFSELELPQGTWTTISNLGTYYWVGLLICFLYLLWLSRSAAAFEYFLGVEEVSRPIRSNPDIVSASFVIKSNWLIFVVLLYRPIGLFVSMSWLKISFVRVYVLSPWLSARVGVVVDAALAVSECLRPLILLYFMAPFWFLFDNSPPWLSFLWFRIISERWSTCEDVSATVVAASRPSPAPLWILLTVITELFSRRFFSN